MRSEFLTLFSATLIIGDVSAQGFKEGASEWLEVRLRGAPGREDITQVEVFVTPEKMLEDSGLGVENLHLELRPEGGCWSRAGDSTPTQRADRWRWRQDILPCLTYSYRVVLTAPNSSCVFLLESSDRVVGAPLSRVANSSFTPSPPTNLKIEAASGSIVWSPVACASQYRVTYSGLGGESREELVTSPSSPLPTLDSDCEGGRVTVRAVSGKHSSLGTQIATPCGNIQTPKDQLLDARGLLEEEDVGADCAGCAPSPPQCSHVAPKPRDAGVTGSSSVIAGLIAAAAILCLLIVVAVSYYRRKRGKSNTDIEDL